MEKGRHVRKKGERGVEVGGGRISVEQGTQPPRLGSHLAKGLVITCTCPRLICVFSAVTSLIYGYEAVVRLLLDTGKVDADSKDKGGQTPLSRAARGHEAVVKLLLGVSEVDADEGSGWSV